MTHWRLRWWLAFFSNQVIFKLGCEYFFRHNNVCILCCCCSVAQSCPTLCDPMNGSTPGLPIPHHLPELAQTHVHWVDDAIQPSHPLQSPFPPAFNFSQHQGLFQWVSSSHQVAKGLVLQHQFFQRIWGYTDKKYIKGPHSLYSLRNTKKDWNATFAYRFLWTFPCEHSVRFLEPLLLSYLCFSITSENYPQWSRMVIG